MPLYRHRATEGQRSPVGDSRTSSAGVIQCHRQIKQDYSAQNARAKISNVHAKVNMFKLLFRGSYFCILIMGLRKSRNFGPHENFPLYGMWQY